jgi:glycosyltransferase involved in cell wall biosynthesis
MAPYILGNEKPKIFDLDTSLTGFAQERLRLENTLFGKIQAWLSLQKTIVYEREIVSYFDSTVVLTEESRASLSPILTKAKNLTLIGNGVDLNHYPFKNLQPVPDTLIYNGSLTFSANYDAMVWFLNEIYPLLIRQMPTISLRITGKYDGVNLESFPLQEGVELTGYIEDIRSAVTMCSVCIVPIRIAGGQRMKILEAMALGTPVVSTSKGAEGLDVTHGEHVLIADKPEEFAKAVLDLLRNESLRIKITQHARILIEEKYNWENILPQFQSIVENVIQETIIN